MAKQSGASFVFAQQQQQLVLQDDSFNWEFINHELLQDSDDDAIYAERVFGIGQNHDVINHVELLGFPMMMGIMIVGIMGFMMMMMMKVMIGYDLNDKFSALGSG
ncbi:hypothetical protein Ancab_027384 [Ancistrocladus abbreviatus]